MTKNLWDQQSFWKAVKSINREADRGNDISSEEWLAHFKNGKSPGPDCVLGELLKYSQETVVPFLTSYFNHLSNNTLFPEQSSKALLVPIHKKGSINDPDNYRGISLLSILSKYYTYILNKRLEVWAESQGKLVEEQGGFRKGQKVHFIFCRLPRK